MAMLPDVRTCAENIRVTRDVTLHEAVATGYRCRSEKSLFDESSASSRIHSGYIVAILDDIHDSI